MNRAILIPTDFSENAWNALIYALNLYVNEPCSYYLLHAWSVSNPEDRTYITAHYVDNLKATALQQLTELKDKAEKANNNTKATFTTIFSTDNLKNATEAAITEHAIDVIVMGTKGTTGSKEFFFGSNTVKLLKMKLCPILVVPDAYDFIEPKEIAFPTDFKRFYGEELLPIKQLAKLFNSKIRIAHITESRNLTKMQDYNLAMLKVYLEDFPHRFHWIPDNSKKTQGINDFIEEFNINILAMINYEHSFIEGIVKEPIVKKIGFHPIVPFFVIPCVT